MPNDTLALVGGASITRDGVKTSKADEIWTMNWSYKYDYIPRIDRLFEMHPIWCYAATDREEYIKPREHWKWLHKARGYPVYMLRTFTDIPESIRYPIEDITECLFGKRLLRDEQPSDFYSSSFDYMMAMAVYEHEKYGWWKRVELYGLEMGSKTEYRYQREGAAFFIGQAVARGMEVMRPNASILMRAKRYGYEGGQMIFRQDLEQLHDHFKKHRAEIAGKLQYWEGKYKAMVEDKTIPEDQIDKAWVVMNTFRQDALIASGAEQAVEYLIQHVDLEEPELELANPYITMDSGERRPVFGNNGKDNKEVEQ